MPERRNIALRHRNNNKKRQHRAHRIAKRYTKVMHERKAFSAEKKQRVSAFTTHNDDRIITHTRTTRLEWQHTNKNNTMPTTMRMSTRYNASLKMLTIIQRRCSEKKNEQRTNRSMISTCKLRRATIFKCNASL